jgi:uncharacterized SAM-binding protein YcdF (DUF218 family)
VPERFSHTGSVSTSEMRRWSAYAVAVAAAVVVAGMAFLTAPNWLPVQDPLRECPALVVLNGDPPFRVEEGARLYHEGRGREVWLTDDPASGDQMGDAGTRWNARRLVDLGVPGASIHIVPGAARGTRAELEAIGAELVRRGFDCTIVVTSPLHTRRAKLTWRRYIGTSPHMVVRHPSDSNYVGWDSVWREVRGLARLCTGFAAQVVSGR